MYPNNDYAILRSEAATGDGPIGRANGLTQLRQFRRQSRGGHILFKGIAIVWVWVLDQEAAKEFYINKLGCTLTNDMELENGMRWLTVRPPGNAQQELLLLDPRRSMLDPENAEAVHQLLVKGVLSPGVMATSDCRSDYATLSESGVTFTGEPTDRPYGVEAILRDDVGNWFSFTERR